MKLSIVTAAALSVLAASPVFAQSKQDFDLINKTGYTIEEVYVSPASSSSWQSDVLGRDVLSNGETVHISFNRAEKTCKWDLKVVYDDKTTAEWDAFDLCQVSKIFIKYDRKSDTTSAEYE